MNNKNAVHKQIQHYVPEVYLKQFANKKKKDFYTNVYNILEDKKFAPNINNICCRRYFYNIKDSNILDSQCLEDGFSEIEGNYRILFENASKNLGWFDIITNKFFTYQLLAIQMLRLPNSKDMYRKTYREACNKELDDNKTNLLILRELLNTIKCKDDNNVPIFLEQLLQNFGSILVCIASDGIEFISSDNPIVVGIDNFKKYGKVIIYPVSTDRCLLFFKKKLTSDNQVINEILKKKYTNSEKLYKNDIEKINACVFASAKNIVISKSIIDEESLYFYKEFRKKVNYE